jgi:hypothetical protein
MGEELETFQSYASRAENRGIPYERLRATYDAAVERQAADNRRQYEEARAERLRAEAAAKKEREDAQRAEDQRQREAHEARLKTAARVAWKGTADAFEAAWPRMLEDTLIEEARESERRARASQASMYNRF